LIRHGKRVTALQLIPYALAGGAGARLGLAYLRRRQSPGPAWLGLQIVLRNATLASVITPRFGNRYHIAVAKPDFEGLPSIITEPAAMVA
jgi:hypothetical protein